MATHRISFAELLKFVEVIKNGVQFERGETLALYLLGS